MLGAQATPAGRSDEAQRRPLNVERDVSREVVDVLKSACDVEIDPIDEALHESFPASDPPLGFHWSALRDG